MRIYQITDVGESEASTPVNEPTPARRVLYYLRKRSNRAASDDMIASSVFGGDKGQASVAIGRLLRTQPPAIKIIGG